MPTDLARAIGEPQRTVQLRQAVVVNTVSGVATIKLGNSATAVTARTLNAASAAPGVMVMVLQQGYDLLVLGPVSSSPGYTAQFNDGLELYHGSSTPYIDFHRAATPAGDSNADYNVRLINDPSQALTLINGGFRTAGGAGVRNFFKDSERTDGNGLRVGAAWGNYGIYAEAGDLMLGSASGSIRFQDTRITSDANGFHLGTPINMTGYKIWTKSYGDDNHRIHHSAGLDSLEMFSWASTRFLLGGALRGEVAGTGLRGYGPATGNNWSLVQLRAEDTTGGSASFGAHAPGTVAHIAELWRGDSAIHWRRSDGAWQWIHADLDDLSMAEIKRDIRDLEPVRARVQRVRPKRFKMKRPNDPTAPLIIARAKEMHERWQEECEEGRWDPRVVEQYNREWEADRVGFLVSDVVEEFPEVVTFALDGTPQGIRYRMLTAVLWRMNQEQDAEIEGLEARIAALEKKPK